MAEGVVKPGPGLAAFLEASKSREILFGDIQKHVLLQASHSDRATDVLHPSEMVKRDWCHRAAYYGLLQPASPRPTTFTRENIFAEGHSTHAKWQRWLQQMGRLAGDWYCRSCESTYWEEETPEECPSCGAPAGAIDYAEVPLNAHQLNIGGKSDGYCPEDNCLLEIKTLGIGSLRYEDPQWLSKYEVHVEGRGVSWDLDRLWRDFNRPLPTALRQGQLYMYLARHFEDLPVDRILYIYEFKPTQQAKAFVAMYDESMSEPLIAAAQAITLCLETRAAPVCNIDSARGCASCRPLDAESAA